MVGGDLGDRAKQGIERMDRTTLRRMPRARRDEAVQNCASLGRRHIEQALVEGPFGSRRPGHGIDVPAASRVAADSRVIGRPQREFGWPRARCPQRVNQEICARSIAWTIEWGLDGRDYPPGKRGRDSDRGCAGGDQRDRAPGASAQQSRRPQASGWTTIVEPLKLHDVPFPEETRIEPKRMAIEKSKADSDNLANVFHNRL